MRTLTAERSTHAGARPLLHPAEFRTDIQGIRALAVLAVVLAHAGIPGFHGGFVGVDVFFVVSGFLISRLLFDEIAATGTIDLVRFWIRRARRLLPNALLTLVATVFLTAFVFRGYDLDSLAREISWTSVELSNFYFAGKAVDYFRLDDAPSPVLHFWSLSVEEQFYAIWPLLLLGLVYFGRGNVLRMAGRALALIWIASLASSILLTPIDQPLAYFGTGTRCWQLATGALLALHWQSITAMSPTLRQTLGYLGSAAIAFSIFGFGPTIEYPGAWGLLPSLGAAGLIVAGSAGNGPVQRVLSLPVMQWIGARSYSWYLWHWPLIILPQTVLPDTPLVLAIAIPGSLLVAWLAYEFVEDPIRRNRVLVMPPRRIGPLAVGSAAAVIGIGWTTQLPLLLEDDATLVRRAAIETARHDKGGHASFGCLLQPTESEQPECLFGDTNANRRIVLFGDSHAAFWFDPLAAAAKQGGWRLNVWTKSSCPAADVPTSSRGSGPPYQICFSWRKEMMARLTGPDRPDFVVISSRTDYSGRIYDPETGSFLRKAEADEAWRKGFRAIVQQLVDASVKVVVIRDIPYAFRHYDECIIDGEPCDRPRSDAVSEPGTDVAVVRSFDHRVVLADFTNTICDADDCPTVQNGMIVYRDYNHLTASFTKTLTPHFVKLLQTLSQTDGKQPVQFVAQGLDGSAGSISPLR